MITKGKLLQLLCMQESNTEKYHFDFKILLSLALRIFLVKLCFVVRGTEEHNNC